MKSLRNILLLNALSSGATGLLLLMAARPIAALFDMQITLPFIGAGIFLLLFATFVLLVALKQPLNLAAVKIVTALDIIWVIASLILVVEIHAFISLPGRVIILAVAAWVALMALLQYKGRKNAPAASFS